MLMGEAPLLRVLFQDGVSALPSAPLDALPAHVLAAGVHPLRDAAGAIGAETFQNFRGRPAEDAGELHPQRPHPLATDRGNGKVQFSLARVLGRWRATCACARKRIEPRGPG